MKNKVISIILSCLLCIPISSYAFDEEDALLLGANALNSMAPPPFDVLGGELIDQLFGNGQEAYDIEGAINGLNDKIDTLQSDVTEVKQIVKNMRAGILEDFTDYFQNRDLDTIQRTLSFVIQRMKLNYLNDKNSGLSSHYLKTTHLNELETILAESIFWFLYLDVPLEEDFLLFSDFTAMVQIHLMVLQEIVHIYSPENYVECSGSCPDRNAIYNATKLTYNDYALLYADHMIGMRESMVQARLNRIGQLNISPYFLSPDHIAPGIWDDAIDSPDLPPYARENIKLYKERIRTDARRVQVFVDYHPSKYYDPMVLRPDFIAANLTPRRNFYVAMRKLEIEREIHEKIYPIEVAIRNSIYDEESPSSLKIFDYECGSNPQADCVVTDIINGLTQIVAENPSYPYPNENDILLVVNLMSQYPTAQINTHIQRLFKTSAPSILFAEGAPYANRSEGYYLLDGEYNGVPLFRHESSGWPIYKKQTGIWVISHSQTPSENWDAISYSNSANALPWAVGWKDSATVTAHDAIVRNVDIAGTYENNLYDSGGKNGWHYVEITKVDDNQFLWTNQAGASWTLTQASSPGVFDVGTSCPYYGSGYTKATVTTNSSGDVVSISGPFNEPYTKQ